MATSEVSAVEPTQRVSLDDASWLHMDGAENPMVVNIVVTLATRPDWDAVIAAFCDRVVDRFPRFRQRVVHAPAKLGSLGGTYWEVAGDFSLDRHIWRTRLEGGQAERALQAYVSDQAGRRIDRDHPRWELHLIDGRGDGAAMLLRTHHSMADGLALVQVLYALADGTDSAPLAGQMPIADASGATRPDSAGAAMASMVGDSMATLVNPLRLRRVASEAKDNAAVYRKLLRMADQRNGLRGTPDGSKWLGWSHAVDLDSVKAAAVATSATVNDVALTVVAGAMHRYLSDLGPPPERVGVTIPFNLRDLDEPLTPELGNQIGLVFLNLPVGLDDSRARLDQIRRRMERIKASPEGQVVRGGMAMVGAIAQRGVAKAWMELFTRRSTAIVTNIVGPRAGLTIAGSPVEDFVLWVPTSGSLAVGLSIVTYNGRLRIGLLADLAVVPRPQRLMAVIDAELDAICSLEATAAP